LSALSFNAKGYKLEIKGNKISIINKVLGEVCFFDKKKLIEIIKEKLGENMLFVIADAKKKNDKEYFHFVEAEYFSQFDEDAFEEMIKDGKIIWEFRLHLKSDTAFRDHGSGFRVNRKYLHEMYKKKIILLS
jgi:hypothetical protein